MSKYISLNEYARKYKIGLRQLRRLRKDGSVEIIKVEDLQHAGLKQRAIEQGLKIMVVDRPHKYTALVNNLKAVQPEFSRGIALIDEGLSVLKEIQEKYSQLLA